MAQNRRHDDAQMMLLTAVILLIGFFALAGTVARVAQLADETAQESRSNTGLETAVVLDGLESAVARLTVLVPPGDVDATQDFLDAVAAAIVHIDELQTARGFSFSAQLDSCIADPLDGDNVIITISGKSSHADVRFSFTADYSIDVDDPISCP